MPETNDGTAVRSFRQASRLTNGAVQFVFSENIEAKAFTADDGERLLRVNPRLSEDVAALVAEVRHLRSANKLLASCMETDDEGVARLRGLLARAIPHIDPNDSDAAHQLLLECEEATRG